MEKKKESRDSAIERMEKLMPKLESLGLLEYSELEKEYNNVKEDSSLKLDYEKICFELNMWDEYIGKKDSLKSRYDAEIKKINEEEIKEIDEESVEYNQ